MNQEEKNIEAAEIAHNLWLLQLHIEELYKCGDIVSKHRTNCVNYLRDNISILLNKIEKFHKELFDRG